MLQLEVGGREPCLPVAQGPSEWGYGVREEVLLGDLVGRCQLHAPGLPQACPKPLGWQPHQSVKELASLREGDSWGRSESIPWPGSLKWVRLRLP